MPEKIPADKSDSRYSSIKHVFDVFTQEIPKQLEEARSRQDTVRIHELEEQRKEFDNIIQSLEAGDTGPAKRKIASAIEENLEFIRLGVPNDLVEETHGERIRRLAGYLADLENLENVRHAPQVEMEARNKGGEVAEEKLGPPTSGTKQLEKAIEPLEAAEQQLEKALSEIRDQKKRLRDSQRQSRLTTLKTEISKQ